MFCVFHLHVVSMGYFDLFMNKSKEGIFVRACWIYKLPFVILSASHWSSLSTSLCFKESPPLIGKCIAVLTGIFASPKSFSSLQCEILTSVCVVEAFPEWPLRGSVSRPAAGLSWQGGLWAVLLCTAMELSFYWLCLGFLLFGCFFKLNFKMSYYLGI